MALGNRKSGITPNALIRSCERLLDLVEVRRNPKADVKRFDKLYEDLEVVLGLGISETARCTLFAMFRVLAVDIKLATWLNIDDLWEAMDVSEECYAAEKRRERNALRDDYWSQYHAYRDRWVPNLKYSVYHGVSDLSEIMEEVKAEKRFIIEEKRKKSCLKFVLAMEEREAFEERLSRRKPEAEAEKLIKAERQRKQKMYEELFEAYFPARQAHLEGISVRKGSLPTHLKDTVAFHLGVIATVLDESPQKKARKEAAIKEEREFYRRLLDKSKNFKPTYLNVLVATRNEHGKALNFSPNCDIIDSDDTFGYLSTGDLSILRRDLEVRSPPPCPMKR